MNENNRKRVFVSYSWDNQEHQEWVLNLSKELMKKFGVDIILDQFELSAGKDLTYFMESSIEKADKVLVILTPNYKLKAENRSKGVGYETSMISQEIFQSPISTVKFIPILREGSLATSTPKFLKSKIYHEMVDDSKYINKLYELSQIIYDKPLIEKPELGEIPDFKDKKIDPIIDIAIAVSNEEKLNNEIDSIMESFQGASLFKDEIEKLKLMLNEKIKLYRTSTALPFNHQLNNRDSYVISVLKYSVSFYWNLPFSNTVMDSELVVRYWNGVIHLERGHYFPGREPKVVKETIYSLDMDYSKNLLWHNQKQKMTTSEIVQQAFLYLIENVQKEKSKKFRS
ncbi:toll/interleukin-1 receptor domain-containing protein [Flavivirga abyssicola]|uniref:toll/interleukin-1 receptor domain-containing protein n=1 Tax=Flavivirga abyssicola TaxID=3063533 RepID=UPI0026E0A015|nr:toll/interleukin-1 receptor domain-containing protein [Flavivirga sp. MEBiC07777]WVK13184.1 toll/interleukin-1 receptor domain-containing protein [Flavivirga sp. MEBiC07777]